MMMRCTCLQNNKTNGSKLLFLESAHLDRRMHESRRSPPVHHHPNPSNEQTTHSSLTFSEISFPEEGTSFDRKKNPAHAPHRTEPLSLSLIRNDRKIRAEKDQITSNPSTPAGNFPRFAPAPTIAAACTAGPAATQQKGVLLFLRYSNEQTRLDHDGQLTNRTRGKGIKTLRCGLRERCGIFFGFCGWRGVCLVNGDGWGVCECSADAGTMQHAMQ
jgi:hypothetical protein